MSSDTDKQPTYADAVLKEMAIKHNVLRDARNMTELSAMALPRHERRRLAKNNGIKNIVGSTKPFIKESTA